MKSIMIAVLAMAGIAGTQGENDPAVEVVRKATERFGNFQVAHAEGWTVALTGCMESDEGGMGYHLANETFLGDGGQLDPTTPEVLLYEPRADGSLTLVGVEYLVPFADWAGAQAPVFMDREMIPNKDFGVWTLHLWLVDNPSGTYVGWNPNVSCRHAAAH